jgi:hypothetical protein
MDEPQMQPTFFYLISQPSSSLSIVNPWLVHAASNPTSQAGAQKFLSVSSLTVVSSRSDILKMSSGGAGVISGGD